MNEIDRIAADLSFRRSWEDLRGPTPLDLAGAGRSRSPAAWLGPPESQRRPPARGPRPKTAASPSRPAARGPQRTTDVRGPARPPRGTEAPMRSLTTTPARARAAAHTSTARPHQAPEPREVLPTPPTEEVIRLRAYSIYLARRGGPGDALSDWLAAEAELKPKHPRPPGEPAPTP